MMRRKSVKLLWPLLVVALVLGGCMKLVDSVFGTGYDPAAAAAGPVTVPSLLGKQLDEADATAMALGLALWTKGISDDYCMDRTDCVVYKMTPTAGTVVQSGDKVAVRFITSDQAAFYKKHRKMPNVVGFTEDRVDNFFDPIRSTVDTDSRESSSVPEGVNKVIAQSPKPGKPLKIGQKIKLILGYNIGSTVSDGDVDIPNGNWRNPCRRSRWC